MAPRLTRGWFARPAHQVAPDLVGRHLVRRDMDGSIRRVRIVETEAYEADDPASHSFNGPTTRNAAMFGPPGHLYVYRIYGVHDCLNVVTGPPGDGSAVLLRAAEPLEGKEAMARARGTDRVRVLCRGPGRLAQALSIDRAFNGNDLLRRVGVWLEPGTPIGSPTVAQTPRIGISVGTETCWRWAEVASRWTTAAPH